MVVVVVVDVVVVVVSYKLKQQLTEKQYAIDLNLPGHMSTLQMYSSGEVVHDNCCHLKTIKEMLKKFHLSIFLMWISHHPKRHIIIIIILMKNDHDYDL